MDDALLRAAIERKRAEVARLEEQRAKDALYQAQQALLAQRNAEATEREAARIARGLGMPGSRVEIPQCPAVDVRPVAQARIKGTLYPHQADITRLIDAGWGVVTIEGGVRNGKTRGCLAACERAMERLGSVESDVPRIWWIVLPTRDPYWHNIRPEVERTWGRVDSGGIITDFNESKTRYRLVVAGHEWEVYIRSGEDADAMRGATIRGAYFVEAAFGNEESFDQIVDRLVASGGPCIVDSSPNGLNWFYRRCIKGARCIVDYRGASGPDYDTPRLDAQADGDERFAVIFGVPIEANRSLSRDAIRRLRTGASRERNRREYDGECFASSGLIWSFDPHAHIVQAVEPDELLNRKDKWEIIAAHDFGWGHPTGHLWIAVSDGRYLVLDEYRESGLHLRVHADNIKRSPWQSYVTACYGDPSAAQAMAEMAEYGVWMVPATNDVELGIDRVAQLLESGRLRFSERCRRLFEEIGNYRRDARGKPVKIMDDLCDPLRYGVASHAQTNDGVPLPYGVPSPAAHGKLVLHEEGREPRVIDETTLETAQEWTNEDGTVKEVI